MSGAPPELMEPVRINQIGEGRRFSLKPAAEELRAISDWLGILDLPRFEAEVDLAPDRAGWRLTGRIAGEAVQACGLTLEPVTETINEAFVLALIEAPEDDGEGTEVEIRLDEYSPDVITDGRIDVSRHVLEHLSLALDPFPRAPGAVFEAPVEAAEISPFAVLKGRLKPDADQDD